MFVLRSIIFLSLSCGSFAFAGKGFGGNSSEKKPLKKTYGREALSPIKDLIDSEGAMAEFFSANEEWKPLFLSLAESAADAMSFINDADINDFEFHETTSPWRRLDAIPTKDEDREVLADFLDNMQTSLVDIPVDELTKEDENDIHFIEEGRRMLVCSRFHVIHDMEQGSIQSYDNLFRTCWSEVAHLRREDEVDTGSLIVVPGCNLDDLRRFTDMNLQRPLKWLGIESFEVACMKQGSPSIRLIHKLSDIPTDIATDPEE